MILSHKYWSKVYIYQILKKLIFFLWRKVYILWIQKSKKKGYVTILLFILYSIWVHVGSPKYKMICLKSPKSSEFAIFFNSGQKSLTKFISSYCNNYLIEFLKIGKLTNIRLCLWWDSNPQSLDLRLRNTCAIGIGCTKKTAENVF